MVKCNGEATELATERTLDVSEARSVVRRADNILGLGCRGWNGVHCTPHCETIRSHHIADCDDNNKYIHTTSLTKRQLLRSSHGNRSLILDEQFSKHSQRTASEPTKAVCLECKVISYYSSVASVRYVQYTNYFRLVFSRPY